MRKEQLLFLIGDTSTQMVEFFQCHVCELGGCKYRDHYITYLGGIKQCKSMVNLRDFHGFPIDSALFGLVI